MAAPTADQILEWTKVDLASLGYTTPEELGVLVERAIAFVENSTGQVFASMPSNFQKLAEQAVQVTVEMLAFQSQEDIAETLADFGLIQSFTAGGYSENRRSLTEIKAAGMISANPILHGLLWSMLTDDKRDEWLGWMTGQNAPAWEVTEVDWGGWGGGADYFTTP